MGILNKIKKALGMLDENKKEVRDNISEVTTEEEPIWRTTKEVKNTLE